MSSSNDSILLLSSMILSGFMCITSIITVHITTKLSEGYILLRNIAIVDSLTAISTLLSASGYLVNILIPRSELSSSSCLFHSPELILWVSVDALWIVHGFTSTVDSSLSLFLRRSHKNEKISKRIHSISLLVVQILFSGFVASWFLLKFQENKNVSECFVSSIIGKVAYTLLNSWRLLVATLVLFICVTPMVLGGLKVLLGYSFHMVEKTDIPVIEMSILMVFRGSVLVFAAIAAFLFPLVDPYRNSFLPRMILVISQLFLHPALLLGLFPQIRSYLSQKLHFHEMDGNKELDSESIWSTDSCNVGYMGIENHEERARREKSVSFYNVVRTRNDRLCVPQQHVRRSDKKRSRSRSRSRNTASSKSHSTSRSNRRERSQKKENSIKRGSSPKIVIETIP